MLEKDTVNTWLAELASPGESMSLNDSGRCLVAVNEAVSCFVEVAQEAGVVVFYSPVMPLLDADEYNERGEVFGKLLAMNLPGGLSRGGALAVDASLDAVVLRYSKAVKALDFQEFANVIEGMAEVVCLVRKEFFGEDGTEELVNTGAESHETDWMKA